MLRFQRDPTPGRRPHVTKTEEQSIKQGQGYVLLVREFDQGCIRIGELLDTPSFYCLAHYLESRWKNAL